MCIGLGLLWSGLAGCSTVSPAGYYWGKYSETLYPLVSDRSEENLKKHAAELQRIVEVSKEKNLKVPPGIYAELGYTFQRLGDQEETNRQYALEIQTYPESRVFLERLMAIRASPDKAANLSPEGNQ